MYKSNVSNSGFLPLSFKYLECTIRLCIPADVNFFPVYSHSDIELVDLRVSVPIVTTGANDVILLFNFNQNH